MKSLALWGFTCTAHLLKRSRTRRRSRLWFSIASAGVEPLEPIIMSSIYTWQQSKPSKTNSITLWKMAPEFLRPITRTFHCFVPIGVDIQVICLCSSFRGTWWKPSMRSKILQIWFLACACKMSLIKGKGWASVTVASFTALKSTTSLYFPGSFFATGKDGLLQGLEPSSHLPSAIYFFERFSQAVLRSPWIWNMRCFTGWAPGFKIISASPNLPLTWGCPFHSEVKTDSENSDKKLWRISCTSGVFNGWSDCITLWHFKGSLVKSGKDSAKLYKSSSENSGGLTISSSELYCKYWSGGSSHNFIPLKTWTAFLSEDRSLSHSHK